MRLACSGLIALLPLTVVAQEVRSDPTPVREAAFVRIGGIDQWISIRGDDASNPVVLLLHGGPGSTLSPFSEAMFESWETTFTLVQWDQRGAGRTFGRQSPEGLTEDFLQANPLTLERMVADGIELSRHLIERFGKDRIVLFGTSWGSALGARMAVKAPELYHAYIGHSQIVNPSADLKTGYRTALNLAGAADDQDSVKLLETLGAPPYSEARSYGQLLRVIKRYEAKNSTAAPDAWRRWAPEYDNDTDRRHRFEGDDYSFLHYVGHAGLGIEAMFKEIDLTKQATNFAIPVFLVQGENDILTFQESTKTWFDSIDAPRKGYHLVPDAAHDFNVAVVKRQFESINEALNPTHDVGAE